MHGRTYCKTDHLCYARNQVQWIPTAVNLDLLDTGDRRNRVEKMNENHISFNLSVWGTVHCITAHTCRFHILWDEGWSFGVLTRFINFSLNKLSRKCSLSISYYTDITAGPFNYRIIIYLYINFVHETHSSHPRIHSGFEPSPHCYSIPFSSEQSTSE
jgi:hypothetical protein